ncbi:MAG: D-alanyl-D-alanine carboxypeptidase, partial [Burkholderiaceae bacterium]|nr:D-alanyl-D-alanine carboxypeptidase [Burkholderiaceae bacterium]
AVKLFDANQAVVTPKVWKGSASEVKVGKTHPLIVAVPAGTASRLKTEVVRNEPVVAPVAAGQQLATLRVLAGEQTVAEVPLGALERVDQAGIFGRAWDGIRLWIR